MDSLVASSARSLAAADPLGAPERIALRGDPSALGGFATNLLLPRALPIE
jgi:hypothetical protein